MEQAAQEQKILDALVACHASGRPLVLLFDYDGTLTPLVDHPSHATLSAEVRNVLFRLTQCPNLYVGILSGRALDDLKAMVALPGLLLSGTGGMEWELDGVRSVHPQGGEAQRLLGQLLPTLETRVRAYPGAWIENKRYACAVHYRQTPASLHAGLLADVESALASQGGRWLVIPGPMAVEILADLECDKGEAMRCILEKLDLRQPKIVYAGDNANDAEAFATAAAWDGLGVGIGDDAPREVPYRLPDTDALLVLLERLDAALGRGAEGPSYRKMK